MARNRIHIDAEPEKVATVLSQPQLYPEWVVGAESFRGADPEFPAKGSRFHHSVTLGPWNLKDHTEVLESELPERIVLKAKARPLGQARVEVSLAPSRGGTEVTFEETPADRVAAVLSGHPPGDVLLRLRNAEALTRLKRIVEGGASVHSPRKGVEGRKALITGGSSGIGLATAGALLDAGAQVTLLARGEEGLSSAVEALGGGDGREVATVTADVRDRAALDAAVSEAAAQMGGLDLLVCSAASISFGPFTETPPADFDATVDAVFGGAVNAIRLALPELERSGGAIVVVGSIAGRMPVPTLSAYTAAKHALVGFVEALRIELAEAGSPVQVSIVQPGPVDTPLWSNLESVTGLLPPAPPDLYSPQEVAKTIVEVVESPRLETIVGAFAALQVLAYSTLRGPTEWGLKKLARLALAAGDRPAGEGSLSSARGKGEAEGGFGGRASLRVGARSAIRRARRAVGVV